MHTNIYLFTSLSNYSYIISDKSLVMLCHKDLYKVSMSVNILLKYISRCIPVYSVYIL